MCHSLRTSPLRFGNVRRINSSHHDCNSFISVSQIRGLLKPETSAAFNLPRKASISLMLTSLR